MQRNFFGADHFFHTFMQLSFYSQHPGNCGTQQSNRMTTMKIFNQRHPSLQHLEHGWWLESFMRTGRWRHCKHNALQHTNFFTFRTSTRLESGWWGNLIWHSGLVMACIFPRLLRICWNGVLPYTMLYIMQPKDHTSLHMPTWQKTANVGHTQYCLTDRHHSLNSGNVKHTLC